MYWYAIDRKLAASWEADLSLPPAPEGTPELFLLRRDPADRSEERRVGKECRL